QIAIGDFDHELAATRRVLERIPDDMLDWKPHERSMTLGELGVHIANIPFWVEAILTEEVFDLATYLARQEQAESVAQILARFDSLAANAKELLAGAGDDALLASWTLRRGDATLFSAHRAAGIRALAVSHLIHHRGQLTVYLRQVGAPVPGIYGPSADE